MESWRLALALGAGVAALLLIAAGLSKIRQPRDFARRVVAYDILPRRIALFVGPIVPVSELVIGLGLVFRPVLFAVPAALLYASFAVAVAVNLGRGRLRLRCACFGPAGTRTISAKHVIANVGLTMAALCGLWSTTLSAYELAAATDCLLIALVLTTWREMRLAPRDVREAQR